MTNKEYMTSDGYERLKSRLDTLQNELSDLRVYKGKTAIHAGDQWHDNPFLYQVEAQERALMRQIAEVETQIRNAVIIELENNASGSSDVVQLGSTVEVLFISDDTVQTFTILGEADSKASAGKLSYKSPLGQALMGKTKDEETSYTVRDHTEKVKVLSIKK